AEPALGHELDDPLPRPRAPAVQHPHGTDAVTVALSSLDQLGGIVAAPGRPGRPVHQQPVHGGWWRRRPAGGLHVLTSHLFLPIRRVIRPRPRRTTWYMYHTVRVRRRKPPEDAGPRRVARHEHHRPVSRGAPRTGGHHRPG